MAICFTRNWILKLWQWGPWYSFQVHWSSSQNWSNKRGGACNQGVELLWCREDKEFSDGSKTSRCPSPDKCLWPIWFCTRSYSLLIFKQHAAVHWRLCPESMSLLCKTQYINSYIGSMKLNNLTISLLVMGGCQKGHSNLWEDGWYQSRLTLREGLL